MTTFKIKGLNHWDKLMSIPGWALANRNYVRAKKPKELVITEVSLMLDGSYAIGGYYK